MDNYLTENIDTVIFDIGNVLIHFAWEDYLHDLGYEGAMFDLSLIHISRGEIIQKSLYNYGYILVTDTMDEAIETANEIASEHLEIQTKNPFDVMTKIRNA